MNARCGVSCAIALLRTGVAWLSFVLDRLCVVLVILLLVAILSNTGLSVFCRYVLNNPLMWTEEIGRYMMIWLAFLGAPIALRRNAHIALEWLYQRLPRRTRRIATLLIRLVMMSILVLVVLVSFPILHRLTGSHSPLMRIPMVLPYASVAVGSLLLIVQNLDLIFSGADRKKGN